MICSALGDRNLSLLGYDTNIILSHNIHAIKIEIAIVFIVQRRKIRPREVKMFIQSEAADEASLQSDFVSKNQSFYMPSDPQLSHIYSAGRYLSFF